ncbi:beta-xylosidase [Mucilaginibacter psychrotolerans]|uniref:Beta-xylosidase n=2 Tax=Mucilaginibacter psychrotolerans TaxID=1524096 RepID=A0A4Y8SEP4_9SPHI|nr:beta-xylosidase [Mucilaginibacter psychrotolerans]
MRYKLFAVLFIFLSLSSHAQAQTEAIRLADPTIFQEKGVYYLYGTGRPDGFAVYTSTDLVKWERHKNNALLMGDSYGTKGFWAPQVFKHKGKYYMAYTANEHIAIAQSDSPLGPFKQSIIKPLSEEGKQIDPFIFKDKRDELYIYHVRLQNGNRIFVARLNEDFTAMDESTAVECLHAERGWENTAKTNWPVSEGPTVIKMGKLYYLLYSANDFRNIDYAVGYATSASPTGPWTKYSVNPILSRTNTGHNGSGHGDIFTAADGKLWYVFHTHNANDKVHDRLSAIIRLSFSAGKPGVFSVVPDTFRYLKVEALPQ